MNQTVMLKKNYEFRRVLSRGKYFSGKTIEAIIIKNGKELNLLGIAVSVKTAKAVRRNQIKRLLRENYRLLEKDLKKGYSIVFLWKKKVDAKEADFHQIKEDMSYIFDKAQLLNRKK